MNPGFPRASLRWSSAGVLLIACALAARAQAPPAAAATPNAASPAVPPAIYSAEQLDQLLGPVALYPDPLLALILPSAVAPGDLVAAAGFLAAHGDPYDAGSQPWSDSVKALVHYPEVVEWMAQNLSWTQAVGAAFAADPDAVTQAVQRLRNRARDAGTLTTTPQQEVVEEDGLLEIQPMASDEIYVPRYDASVVFLAAPDPDYGPFLTFGSPYQGGLWLNYGFDWRRHALWVGHFSRDAHGWSRPNTFSADAHAWRPPAGHGFPGRPPARPGGLLVRPSLLPGAPHPSAADRARWENFHPRPGENPGARSFVRPDAFPGGPSRRAGFPVGAERLNREREERERAAPRPRPPAARPPVPAAAARAPAQSDQNERDDHSRPAR